MSNAIVLDRSKLPKDGAGFLMNLQRQPFFIPTNIARTIRDGFPKFFVAPYSIAGEHQPNLINIWCFEDEEKNAYIIGGIAGPTRSPARDWKQFDEYLESIRQPEQYERVLELLNDALVTFINEKPHLFR